MFEVVAKRDVTVKSFSFYTDAARTGVIEVYTRVGTYKNNELVSTGWQLVYNRNVQQNGQSVLTVLGDLDTVVTIPTGSIQSFYMVTANYIMYDAGSIEGTVFVEDSSLVLYQGELAIALLFMFSKTAAEILFSMLFSRQRHIRQHISWNWYIRGAMESKDFQRNNQVSHFIFNSH
jgi:hypothetical protein